jgi:hypothetical protein
MTTQNKPQGDALRDALELAREGLEIHEPSMPEYKVCEALIGMAAGIEALAASKHPAPEQAMPEAGGNGSDLINALNDMQEFSGFTSIEKQVLSQAASRLHSLEQGIATPQNQGVSEESYLLLVGKLATSRNDLEFVLKEIGVELSPSQRSDGSLNRPNVRLAIRAMLSASPAAPVAAKPETFTRADMNAEYCRGRSDGWDAAKPETQGERELLAAKMIAAADWQEHGIHPNEPLFGSTDMRRIAALLADGKAGGEVDTGGVFPEWKAGTSAFKQWCCQYFGPDADESYLAEAVLQLPRKRVLPMKSADEFELHRLLAEERYTVRQLNRALREATEAPTFMGEPVTRPPQPAAQETDWRDGVNVARLRAALTRMGIATEPSEEGTAADLENWVNTLTRAVAAGQPAAQVAQPLTPDQLADRCESWLHSAIPITNVVDAFESGFRDAEAAHGIGKDQAS